MSTKLNLSLQPFFQTGLVFHLYFRHTLYSVSIYITYVALKSRYDFWGIQIWGYLYAFDFWKFNVVKDSVERYLFSWTRSTLPFTLCFIDSTLFNGPKKHSNSKHIGKHMNATKLSNRHRNMRNLINLQFIETRLMVSNDIHFYTS